MQKKWLSIDFKYIVRNLILSKNIYIYNNFLLYMFPLFGFNLRITYKNILNKL